MSCYVHFELAVSIRHPGSLQLITMNSSVILTYYADNPFSLYDR